MEQTVYIIGHRNPDTDSVVSAAAYAAFKQALGTNCRAARAGNMNSQTEYVFERFRAPEVEYLPDVIPKAAHYVTETPAVHETVPLWDALERMERENLRALPIVDSLGVYKSMLHYRGFSRYIITHINPHQKSVFPLSIDLVAEVLRAQMITLFNAGEVRRSSIIIAASYNKYFISHLEDNDIENVLVIMGDRLDLQKYCVERKVRALILSNGYIPEPELVDLAKKNNVSVMSSPYDTSSTAMLIMYSVPAGAMGDDTVPLARLSDPIRNLRPLLAKAPSRCLPIGDDEGRVTGILFEGDLAHDPNIGIIMVDHNEMSQAVEGIEHHRILEVIDHHRLGNLSTRYPITFINKPVGATSTIIAGLYREQRLPIKKEIASILLCGILSDTLSLKSATTTETDMETAEYLAELTGLDTAELGRELQNAANRAHNRPAKEFIAGDMKEYDENGVRFSVSQVETSDPQALVARKDEILSVLEELRGGKFYFSALLVTDVTALDSLLFVSGEKGFISSLTFPRREKEIFTLKGIVSRKKQLLPLLTELLEKADR
ncbi:MAG: putative manganese-dependent inorganic diphosphatase [Treponema sp.]|jgi:manganese-dependent inorganic pyrophosphatase|nr:putative manganese-dependent inorganic diphosphatase [Treponema sp.]